MIDVALLGCGGSMPIPNRYLTSLLISYRGRKILIDCGEGTQVSMKILGWGFKSIDIICITHFHADHVVGLPGLLSTMGNSGRTEPIIIIGPKGLKEILTGLRVIIPFLPFDIITYEEEKEYPFRFSNEKLTLCEEYPEIIISIINLIHTADCLGYRLDISRKPLFDPIKATEHQIPKQLWSRLQKGEVIHLEDKTYEPNMVLGHNRPGIRLSYITDTRPFDEIIDFIKGSVLFICEGMYGDDNDLEKAIKNKHMLFSEAATLALRGEVNELVLTHFSPVISDPHMYLDQTKLIFNNTTIGYDRLTRMLNFNIERK